LDLRANEVSFSFPPRAGGAQRAGEAVSDELWIQHLRTNQLEVLSLGRGGLEEAQMEDCVVSGLVDFNDISYDEHADPLYDLAGQFVQHFKACLTEADTRKVLRCYQKPIAQFIHSQMQAMVYWPDRVTEECKTNRSFAIAHGLEAIYEQKAAAPKRKRGRAS
jgi:hypothetical protein